jgi:hypothetical protein
MEPGLDALPAPSSRTLHSAPAPRTSVPFFDPAPIHETVAQGLLQDISELIDSGLFVNGPWIGEFEEEFAADCETRH